MSFLHLLKVGSVVETLLTWVALIVCFRSSIRNYISAMRAYLLVQAVGGVLMDVLINFRIMSPDHRYTAYFCVYWLSFVGGAAAIVLVMQQVFQQSLSPLPGLRRLGLVGFRWIVLGA